MINSHSDFLNNSYKQLLVFIEDLQPNAKLLQKSIALSAFYGARLSIFHVLHKNSLNHTEEQQLLNIKTHLMIPQEDIIIKQGSTLTAIQEVTKEIHSDLIIINHECEYAAKLIASKICDVIVIQ